MGCFMMRSPGFGLDTGLHVAIILADFAFSDAVDVQILQNAEHPMAKIAQACRAGFGIQSPLNRILHQIFRFIARGGD